MKPKGTPMTPGYNPREAALRGFCWLYSIVSCALLYWHPTSYREKFFSGLFIAVFPPIWFLIQRDELLKRHKPRVPQREPLKGDENAGELHKAWEEDKKSYQNAREEDEKYLEA